jgi:gas vesicle protein
VSTERKPYTTSGLFLLGLMLGAAVGAAIGLLYAPRPGMESRQDLVDWADGLRSRAAEEPEPLPETDAPAEGSSRPA